MLANKSKKDFATSWDEKSVAQALGNLKHAIESRYGILHCPSDDLFLEKFLYARDLNPELAFELFSNYVTIIRSRPDIFNWSKEVRDAVMAGCFLEYPRRNAKDGLTVLVRAGKWNPYELNVETLLQMALFMTETSLLSQDMQKNGLIAIIDTRGISWTQFYKFGMANIKTVAHYTDRCAPVYIKKVHVLYENRLVSFVYNIVKKFISPRLQDLIVFHGHHLESLQKFFPLSCLPKSVGGTDDEPDWEQIYHQIEENKDQIQSSWELIKENF